MDKNKMVHDLSHKMNTTLTETRALLDSTFDILAEILVEGNSINIPKFGTFSVTKLEERKGFNPLIQKWMMLPPKLKTKFKPSNILKEKVNKNGK